jgi:hypothetical protein
MSMSIARSLGIAAASLLLAVGCSSPSGSTGTGGHGGGTGGGAGGMGGMGGGGGMSVCPVADDVISDFTTDNGLSKVDGRMGGWFTYGDKSGRGTLVPAEGGGAAPDLDNGNTTCSGPGSLHVTSMGFSDWGSAMGADFVAKVNTDAGTAAGTYDATKYRGIAFWAKAAAPIPFVQVALLDPYTAIPSILPADQQCIYDATMPDKNCSPYLVKFGYGYMGEAMTGVMEDFPKFINTQIDTTWKRFEILFTDMKQDRTNPGRQSPGNTLAVSQITGIRIQVNTDHSTTPPTPVDWEIWVDDVSFIK